MYGKKCILGVFHGNFDYMNSSADHVLQIDTFLLMLVWLRASEFEESGLISFEK